MNTSMLDREQQERLISILLYWVWSCRLQVERLIESTHLEHSGDRPRTPVVQGQACSRTSYDEHLVLVAGRHVVNAVDLATAAWPQLSIDPELGKQMRLLRNVYEHWNDPWEGKPLRSLEKFKADFPHGQAESITYTSDDWLIGGVVSLREFFELLGQLEAAVLPMSIWQENDVT